MRSWTSIRRLNQFNCTFRRNEIRRQGVPVYELEGGVQLEVEREGLEPAGATDGADQPVGLAGE